MKFKDMFQKLLSKKNQVIDEKLQKLLNLEERLDGLENKVKHELNIEELESRIDDIEENEILGYRPDDFADSYYTENRLDELEHKIENIAERLDSYRDVLLHIAQFLNNSDLEQEIKKNERRK